MKALSVLVLVTLVTGLTSCDESAFSDKPKTTPERAPLNGDFDSLNDLGDILDVTDDGTPRTGTTRPGNDSATINPDLLDKGDGEHKPYEFILDCNTAEGHVFEIGSLSTPEPSTPVAPPAAEPEEGKTKLNLEEDSKAEPQPEPKKDDSPYPSKGEPVTPDKDPPKLKEDPKVVASIRGKFCPEGKKSSDRTIIMVDFSGSMGTQRNRYNQIISNGNDNPAIVGRRCDRYRGITNILSKMDPESAVTIIPFATQVLTGQTIQGNAQQIIATLEPETVCVAEKGTAGFTNYQAIFNLVTQQLATASAELQKGRTHVLFISDGLPTWYAGANLQIPEEQRDREAQRLAKIAGSELLSTVPNIELSAVLLGQDMDEPRALLQEVIGEPVSTPMAQSRVKVADEIGSIQQTIASLPAAQIDANTWSATLDVPPFGLFNLSLAEPPIIDNGPNGVSWNYITNPFYLVGKKGQTIDHFIDISVKGMQGETYNSRVIIRYSR